MTDQTVDAPGNFAVIFFTTGDDLNGLKQWLKHHDIVVDKDTIAIFQHQKGLVYGGMSKDGQYPANGLLGLAKQIVEATYDARK